MYARMSILGRMRAGAWPKYASDRVSQRCKRGLGGNFKPRDGWPGQRRARFRPRLLILSHIVRRGETDGELLAAVRHSFDGRVVVGHDLERY